MSLTDRTPAPWPPFPPLPNDVMAEINYVSVDQGWMGQDRVRLRLQGGEVLEFPRDTNPQAVVDTVRGAMLQREFRAVMRTKCPCCSGRTAGGNAPDGCVLPPGETVRDDNRCSHVDIANPDGCRCWGGLAADGRRYCEDCWLSYRPSPPGP